MSSKIFESESIGKIEITKRRSSRNLRITLSPEGLIKVSIPTWAPYKTGLDFAHSKAAWINSKKARPNLLYQDQQIGKAHQLKFVALTNLTEPKTRIRSNQIIISYPVNLTLNDSAIQLAARKAVTRALRKQAESLLPQRLANLSELHNLPVDTIKIKQLTRRWGSCDQSKQVVLNLFLIQLPWNLIDYVILHELAHTKHMNHGPQFWSYFESILPNAKIIRKQLNTYQPGIISSVSGIIDDASLQ